MLTGKGYFTWKLQEMTKLHSSLDALDGIGVEVGESLGLKDYNHKEGELTNKQASSCYGD